MHSFLVYCPENFNVAENITQNLKQAGIEISHDTRRLEDRIDEYKSFSANQGSPIILLISDNFLKDKACMYEALNFLHNPSMKNRVFPIIADGRHEDALGNVNYSPTRFERVSNVIHYLNYWQDQYLEMRKIKRDSDLEHDEQFIKEIDTIRSISSEIGEFLRILRASDYVDFDRLHSSKFEGFFRKANWNNAFASFSSREMIPFVIEENVDLGIDITSIPGINLVTKTTKIEHNDPKEETETTVIPELPEIEETLLEDNTVEESLDVKPVEGVDLLNKVSEHKNQVEEVILDNIESPEIEVPELDTPEIIEETVEALGTPKEVVEDITEEIEEIEIEKEAFEKEGLSYEDKSSYDLLVSLFEDENGGDESHIENKVESLFHDDPEEEENIEPEVIEEEIEEETVMDDVINDMETEEESIVKEPEIFKVYDRDKIAACIENGDTLGAMKMLKDTMLLEPNNPDARYQYALLLSDHLKNYNEAKHHLKTVVSLDNKNIEAFLRLAELHEVEEDYIGAKECYEKAINLDDTYPGLHHKYAVLLHHKFKAQKKKALKHYKIAVKQDDDNVDALYQYAIMQYEYQGKTKKALKKFQQVIQMEPNHPFANYDIAVLYYELGKGKLAAQYYIDAYQNNPELKTEKNDEAFKIVKYLSKINTQEETVETEEVIDEIVIDDISDLQETYELTIENEGQIEKTAITYQKIEELLEEGDSFEDLEDESIFTEEVEAETEEESADVSDEIEESVEELLEEVQEEIEEEEEEEEEEEDDDDDEAIDEIIEDEVVEATTEESITEDESHILETPLIDVIEELEEVEEELISSDEELTVEIEEITEILDTPVLEEEEIDETEDDPIVILEAPIELTSATMITGATSGIGLATARIFAKNGHNLIITGRRSDRLETLKQELESEHGVSVETLEFDVRNLSACKAAMEQLPDTFNNIDILVNNAGLAKGKHSIHQGDIEHWDTMIDTNIKGLLYMTRLVSPGMVNRGFGHIINIGSIAGKEVYPNGNVYCATKHAVDALTKAMRIDLHQHNIRVSAVHPGAVEETEFSMVRHDFDASKARDYQDFTPVNARDIADIIYFITTRPPHVNIQDILVMGTQQATATIIDKSGRK